MGHSGPAGPDLPNMSGLPEMGLPFGPACQFPPLTLGPWSPDGTKMKLLEPAILEYRALNPVLEFEVISGGGQRARESRK